MMTIDASDARIRAAFRRRRKALALRQEDVADRAGVGKSTVSRYESGDTTPDGETLERMITAIESTAGELDTASRSPAAAVPAAPAARPTEPPPLQIAMPTRTATPDQIVDYLHAEVTAMRWSHPEHLPELAAAVRACRERLLIRRLTEPHLEHLQNPPTDREPR